MCAERPNLPEHINASSNLSTRHSSEFFGAPMRHVPFLKNLSDLGRYAAIRPRAMY